MIKTFITTVPWRQNLRNLNFESSNLRCITIGNTVTCVKLCKTGDTPVRGPRDFVTFWLRAPFRSNLTYLLTVN